MPEETTTAPPTQSAPDGGWDDGVIARRAPDRVNPGHAPGGAAPPEEAAFPEDEPLSVPPAPHVPGPATEPVPDSPPERDLTARLAALRQLVGLSRSRVPAAALAEAGRVLDEADARRRLPRAYTTVALAGATGSGKSTLFNALAGAQLSEAGVRRPTTATAVACTWDAGKQAPGHEGLLERLSIPSRSRRRAHLMDQALRGLILLDLPDYDSAAPGHREQVDRMLALTDAVIWVVDPEKYADAVLHERYLRAFAGHADVSIVVLNQTDRLPRDAADAILDDLRRLLDERGIALGEHGEPGAAVLPVSALTGDGVPELRGLVGELVSTRTAAARRLTADLDGAARRLRHLYVADTVQAPCGLTAEAREAFDERLAQAIGAQAAALAAERRWLRRADRVCGTPWTQVTKWLAERRAARRGEPPALSRRGRDAAGRPPGVSRPMIDEAVRGVADQAAVELPAPWAQSVRDAAWRGAAELPRALESALARPPEDENGERLGPPRPRWWTAAVVGQALLLAAQLLGVCWLALTLAGHPVAGRWLPVYLLVGGALGAPVVAWLCRISARAPARAWGAGEEERLRRLAAGCGRAHILEPVAAELLRYREVRESYVTAAGGPDPRLDPRPDSRRASR